MASVSDRSRSLLASHGTLRRGGLWLRLSAGAWAVHATLVVAFGISILAIKGSNYDLAAFLAPVVRLAPVMASTGAVALGFGLWSLATGSSDLVSSTPERIDRDSARLAIPRIAHRNGKIAVLLCFLYAGVGLVAVPYTFLGADLALSVAVSNLWLLAAGVLFLVGVYGGDFLEKFLSLVAIYDDPLHLLRWYAALTALFANPFLLVLGLYYSGFLGVFFLALPFGLCPLLGFAAFRKIYQVGSRLVRMNPRLRFPRIDSRKFKEPAGPGGS